MKKVLCVLLFTFTLIGGVTAQKKHIAISEIKAGPVTAFYFKEANLETGDTSYYVFLRLQNAEYSNISDQKAILFTKQRELIQFIKDLKAALLEMGNKQIIAWTREQYKISLFDSSNLLYLYESPSEGNGYTTLDKNDVEKLITWLETIKIGKDMDLHGPMLMR